MATVDECRDALHQLAARMDANAEAAGKIDLDRPLACSISISVSLSTASWSAAG